MNCQARVTSQEHITPRSPVQSHETVSNTLSLWSLCLDWCKWPLRHVMRMYSRRDTSETALLLPPVRSFYQKKEVTVKSNRSWEETVLLEARSGQQSQDRRGRINTSESVLMGKSDHLSRDCPTVSQSSLEALFPIFCKFSHIPSPSSSGRVWSLSSASCQNWELAFLPSCQESRQPEDMALPNKLARYSYKYEQHKSMPTLWAIGLGQSSDQSWICLLFCLQSEVEKQRHWIS